MTGNTVEQQVFGLGRGIEQEAVVIGSNAVQLALPGFQGAHNTDIAVSQEAFAYLQQQPDWEQTADGLLMRDGMHVGTGWGDAMDYAGLQGRSWQTEAGVRVAGLPDVYAYKQRRGTAADVRDMAVIRDHLQGASHAPLAARCMPHEVAAAQQCLPEELHDHPQAAAAILLAANGLHTVYTIYGHPGIGQANQITGDLERPDFWVPATYHNGFGLIDDARALQRHLDNVGAPAHDRLLALAIDPFTDAVYGNGRPSDNPESYDELRSADLLRARALQFGFSKADAQRMHKVTLETAFDEATGTQRGKYAIDPLARAVVAVDLQTLSERDWLEQSIDLAVEDGCSARFNKARTLGRVLVEQGQRVYRTAEALECIDRYADAKPADAPDGPTVIEYVARRLMGNGAFQRKHEYPAGWTLNNPQLRQRHADAVEILGARLLAREITAVEAGQLAAAHTQVC
ncbi:MAG TPA: hypothetical protein VD735_04215 [Candidatus Saccharimonadales bacterium]|nr:hypothetical protein [Candidatus Saccharimonadales bacterium]